MMFDILLYLRHRWGSWEDTRIIQHLFKSASSDSVNSAPYSTNVWTDFFIWPSKWHKPNHTSDIKQNLMCPLSTIIKAKRRTWDVKVSVLDFPSRRNRTNSHSDTFSLTHLFSNALIHLFLFVCIHCLIFTVSAVCPCLLRGDVCPLLVNVCVWTLSQSVHQTQSCSTLVRPDESQVGSNQTRRLQNEASASLQEHSTARVQTEDEGQRPRCIDSARSSSFVWFLPLPPWVIY